MADHVNKSVNCPINGFNIFPAGSKINITDLIISTNGATDVTLWFNPPRIVVLTTYMDGNETVVTNFRGDVENPDEQALKITCGGEATVSVTLVGTGRL